MCVCVLGFRLDMDWRNWKNGEEGKAYSINTDLFPDMKGFYSYAHAMVSVFPKLRKI